MYRGLNFLFELGKSRILKRELVAETFYMLVKG
jgi:hypothetical protein